MRCPGRSEAPHPGQDFSKSFLAGAGSSCIAPRRKRSANKGLHIFYLWREKL
ncbi:hypothetical protein SELSPUOL_02380 [Selenomonas sputigena ATCC 35185]|uniref:Uncharacterized protein n=1 Tax=Selenomonas sputigena (strain ATCC 35185 / DSM 20758 / CCUG 44933 / VPI D19B-28) TaxID=546271 RepID=C9LY21_SELS3|nr:hypothetical protein SELSPUOL_02380 [Selenomonas sputigena ATCC 35185]